MQINFGNIDFSDSRDVDYFLQKLNRTFNLLLRNGPLIIGGGPVIQRYLSVSVAYDPPSIASGAQAATTVTLAGAALGDIAVASFDKDLQGLQMTAYVSAANTVTVVLKNDTGGAVDLGSGHVRTSVWQH